MLTGVPARHVARAPLDEVAQQAHRRVHREAPLLLGDVLLEDVRLDRAAQALGRDAVLLGRHDVEGEHDRRGALMVIDTETSPTSMPLNSVSMSSSVSTATPSRPTSPSERAWSESWPMSDGMSNAVLRPGLPVVEQVVEPLVGLLRRAEAGELAHRPQAAPVHRGVHAAVNG
jgi:hypothetical protein